MLEKRIEHRGAFDTMRCARLAARLVMAGIFIYASCDKIAHPATFARGVYNYQILPDALVNLTAIVLPWLELFLSLCLLAGIWLPGAVLWKWCVPLQSEWSDWDGPSLARDDARVAGAVGGATRRPHKCPWR